MAFVALGAIVLLVVGAAVLSSRRHASIAGGCCAPADPRHDLRMGAAFEDDNDDPRSGPRSK